jgi:hypothetical protein
MNTPQHASRPPASRSALTNRPLHIRNVDGRTVSARRYRDICLALTDDLGGTLSESQQILVRQSAALTVAVESLQAKIVGGVDVDAEQLVRLSNVQARTLARLGIKKPTPPRPPTLMEALRAAPRLSPL